MKCAVVTPASPTQAPSTKQAFCSTVVVAMGGHKVPMAGLLAILTWPLLDTKSQRLPVATMEIMCWNPP